MDHMIKTNGDLALVIGWEEQKELRLFHEGKPEETRFTCSTERGWGTFDAVASVLEPLVCNSELDHVSAPRLSSTLTLFDVARHNRIVLGITGEPRRAKEGEDLDTLVHVGGDEEGGWFCDLENWWIYRGEYLPDDLRTTRMATLQSRDNYVAWQTIQVALLNTQGVYEFVEATVKDEPGAARYCPGLASCKETWQQARALHDKALP